MLGGLIHLGSKRKRWTSKFLPRKPLFSRILFLPLLGFGLVVLVFYCCYSEKKPSLCG